MAKKKKSILRPGKEITASNADTLGKKWLKKTSEGIKELVLDLSKVETIDSVGLGLILATQNTMTNFEGNLKLIKMPEGIYGLFHAMRLDRHIDIHPL